MPSKIRDIAEILGVTETANTTNAVLTSVADGSGLVVYATLDDLPTSGLTAGDQAYVTSTNRLYVSNGTGWYNVALFNATPTLSISPSGAVTLAVDGSTPTVITLTGTDSDNADANLVYSVESDGSFSNIATLSQDSSVFTITPLSEDSATPGSSTLTFKVSDGISFGSGTTEFSLTFGPPDWSGSYTDQILDGDATAYSIFGASIGMSGDGNYAFIADQSGGGSTNVGRLWAYSKSGSTWSIHTAFGTADGSNATMYNPSQADLNVDGTFGVFGLPAYNSNKGGLRVYKRTGNTYGNAQTYTQTADVGAQLGKAVAISNDGNYIIAGAPGASGGKVHFFNLSDSANNTWSTNGVFSSTNLGGGHVTVGDAVAIDATGVYAVAGVPSEGSSYAGWAYIYKRTGSTWALETTLANPDNEADARFGGAVAINNDGDVLYVGAYRKDQGAAGDAGKIHMYTRSGTTWTLRDSFTSATSSGDAYFGRSIACNANGDLMVTGVPYTAGGAAAPGLGGGIEIWTKNGNTMNNTRNIANINLQSGGLSAGSAESYDLFGWPVAINNSGDEIMATSRSGQKTGSVNGTTGVVAAILLS